MLKRIKTIKSYTGHARFLGECIDTPQYLARRQTFEIPSPYRYSPSISILNYRGKNVVWFETKHRTYEVYEIPPQMTRFNSEQAATDYHCA